MKVFLIIAAMVVVANAKLSVVFNDKKIESPHLDRMDFTEIKFGKEQEVAEEIPHDKNAIDDAIIAFLESIRDQMDVGWPELGIPPLDPFNLERANVVLNQPLVLKLNITAKNVLLTGLQQFIIKTIKFNAIRLSFEFELVIPDLSFESGYEVNGRAGVVYPFAMTGDVKSRMQGFRFLGNMALGVTSDGFLTLRTFDLVLDMREMSLVVTGLPQEGPLGDLVEWISGQLTDEFLHQALENISKTLTETMFDSINEALGNISLSDIIG